MESFSYSVPRNATRDYENMLSKQIITNMLFTPVYAYRCGHASELTQDNKVLNFHIIYKTTQFWRLFTLLSLCFSKPVMRSLAVITLFACVVFCANAQLVFPYSGEVKDLIEERLYDDEPDTVGPDTVEPATEGYEDDDDEVFINLLY